MRRELFLVLLFCMSCKTNKPSYSCENERVLTYNLSDVQEKELVIAVEKCKKGKISFCGRGFDRVGPAMIMFDSINIIESYNKGVFMYYYEWHDDSVLKNTIFNHYQWFSPTPHYDQDSTFIHPFISTDSTAILRINNRKYFNRLEKSSFSDSKKGDSFLEYDIYSVKMKFIYAGKRCITLPNIQGKTNRQNLFINRKIPCYYIIELSNVKPYNKGKLYSIKY